MPTLTTNLFVNQNGRVACPLPRCGGSYLHSAVNASGGQRRIFIDTPLDNWMRIVDAEDLAIIRESSGGCECGAVSA